MFIHGKSCGHHAARLEDSNNTGDIGRVCDEDFEVGLVGCMKPIKWDTFDENDGANVLRFLASGVPA